MVSFSSPIMSMAQDGISITLCNEFYIIILFFDWLFLMDRHWAVIQQGPCTLGVIYLVCK